MADTCLQLISLYIIIVIYTEARQYARGRNSHPNFRMRYPAAFQIPGGFKYLGSGWLWVEARAFLRPQLHDEDLWSSHFFTWLRLPDYPSLLAGSNRFNSRRRSDTHTLWFVSSADEMGLDGLQSGYMSNHKMDPAVVGSANFGKYTTMSFKITAR